MLSRRRLLQAGTVAATVSAIPRFGQAEEKISCAPPPTISNLKSMKAQATPIAPAERLARQEKARQLMTANHVDAIVLTAGTSLHYFTGIRWWSSERLLAAILPAKGSPFYVCPAFEEGRAREQLGESGNQAEVRTWNEDESSYALVAQGLKDRGLSSGTIGIEEAVPFVFSNEIAKSAPQIRSASAIPVTAGCRMIKSDHEIALMRLASRVTLSAYEAVYKTVKEGMTRAQIEELIAQAHTQLGFSGDALVLVGENSAFPHGSVAPQVIREGTIVLIDGGCSVEGYASDITRVFVLGKPPDKMKQVFDIVYRAQSEALKTARPGIECQGVDAVARKVITDAGYGPDYKFFTHRVGHGMGMDVHEWPYLVRGNATKLETGMTFSDEPGIYIRGEFGVRLEDDMHITENGAELLTPQSPSLEEPFSM